MYTKGESITVPLTSCLTGLESAVCFYLQNRLIQTSQTVILPSLVFPGVPLRCSPVRGYTRVGSSCACEYCTKVAVTGSDKHTVLTTAIKSFIVQAHGVEAVALKNFRRVI
jgi:hypothetical protein